MIKSVSFPKRGKGYIYEKIEEPPKPEKYYREWSSLSEEDFQKAVANWEVEHAEWEAHKNDYLRPLVSNTLVGKTFKFVDKKVNVLFGPNACGKSTVLKSIAGTTLVKDGFTTIYGANEIIHRGWDAMTKKDLDEHILHCNGNTSTVKWDGTPIYFDKFSTTYAKNNHEIGGLIGNVFGSLGEEMIYRLDKNKISDGQNTNYLLSRVLRYAKENRSTEEVIAPFAKKIGKMNDVWDNVYQLQIDYLKSFEKYSEKAPTTFVFDEIDKSLDIMTVFELYKQALPYIVEEYGCQIILVSHNPLVLADAIYNDEHYNVISMVEGYTDEARKILKSIKF